MKLGILTIATNRYLEYFEDLVKSYIDVYPNSNNLEWYLFTNRVGDAKEITKKIPVKVKVIEVPAYSFPEATLLRYKIYLDNAEQLESDLLMHLDADMLIKSGNFLNVVSNSAAREQMTLIKHPGFFRPHGISRLFFYTQNPRYLVIDLVMLIKFGGIGSWETNEKSRAFVSRKKRNLYFCGGIWFGYRSTVIKMCSELSAAVDQDIALELMAKWHDESHLNAFASRNKIVSLDPELCFEPKYPSLKGLTEIVRAVDKNEE